MPRLCCIMFFKVCGELDNMVDSDWFLFSQLGILVMFTLVFVAVYDTRVYGSLPCGRIHTRVCACVRGGGERASAEGVIVQLLKLRGFLPVHKCFA